MQKLPNFVDMARTPEEIKEASDCMSGPRQIYPYGLCISLCQEDLDKLNLDEGADVGDLIHMHAIGKVTSVNRRDTDEGPDMRVEIQLTAIAVENESEEDEEAEEVMLARRPRNPYAK